MNQDSAEYTLWLHIPKCAGTYLNDALINSRTFRNNSIQKRSIYTICYPPDYNLTFKRLASLELEEKKEIKHIVGHMRFGLHEHLPGKCRYITVLRDPVERVISLYYFVRSSQHPLRQEVQKMSLKDFVESGITCEANNGQARMLAGISSLAWYGEMDRPFNEDDYTSALKNVNSFYHIGFQDRLSDTIRELNLRLRLGLAPSKHRINKTKAKPQANATALEIETILKHNSHDLRLYKYCKEKFRLPLMRKLIGYIIDLNTKCKAS